jgi:hypothetical protein
MEDEYLRERKADLEQITEACTARHEVVWLSPIGDDAPHRLLLAQQRKSDRSRTCMLDDTPTCR